MQIDITGHQMAVTAALRDRVEKTLARLAQHAEGAIQRASVVLEARKRQHRCDIRLSLGGGDSFVAKDESDDMHASIDKAADKLRRQMATAKGRRDGKHGH